MMILHRFTHQISKRGWRGSRILWSFADFFVERPVEGSKVILPNGMPLIYSNKDWTAKTIFEGTYERELLSILEEFICDQIYVDIGANLGVTLWSAMTKCIETSNWIAFEPSNRCRENLELVGTELGVQGYHIPIAISDKAGRAVMNNWSNPLHSGIGTLRDLNAPQEDSIEVKVSTLDEEVAKLFPEREISLLKIDTEGLEGKVVRGAKKLFKSGRVKTIILEVSPMFETLDYLDELASLLPSNYQWYEIASVGLIRRKARLVGINGQDCKARTNQFNLLVTADAKPFKRFIVG